MKHLKSSFGDLHRLFEQSITVRDIAEPLASFDRDYPAERARDFMASRGFDVVGVRREGSIEGYILQEDLTTGTVGDHLRELEDADIMRESDPLLRALESLKTRRWTFIRFLGDPSGIVTRGDLQKAPMRMWLFGLISILEMQMLRCIRAVEDSDDWWSTLLSDDRLAAAQRIFHERRKRNEEIFLSDCLQIADKAFIYKKNDDLFALTGLDSKRSWKDFMINVEELRNNLAHANDLGTDSWPEIAELAIKLERVLKSLEKEATSTRHG